MYSLQGKKVLYFAPRFFGYDSEIAEEIASRGAQINILPDRVFDTPLMKGVTKLRRDWVIPAANKFYRKKISEFEAKHYDMIFVVNGQTLSQELLKELRALYPQAKFVLYMWDAVKNRQSAIENLEFFDFHFTFDRDDAEKFGMVFRPLFFSKGFENLCQPEMLYDLSFVGTAHTDRYALIKAVSYALSPEIKPFWYLYLQAPWVFYYYKITNPVFRSAEYNDFKFEPLDKQTVQSIFFASRAVLDVEHPGQQGLTIRTIEALGSAKKLITTNAKVKNYDFYSPDNICVIDRKKPCLPKDFFSSDYSAVEQSIYYKYSLQGWLEDILCSI